MLKKSLKILLMLIAVWVTAVSAALPEKVVSADGKATTQNFPDADFVLLRDDETVRYDEKGISETRDAYFLKVLTEKGRRKLRSIPVAFNRHYDRITLQKLVIYRNDKEIVPDLKGCVTEESDNRSLKHNICDVDDRILRINLPELEIGDVIFFDFSCREVVKRMPGAWQEIAMLQADHPCMEYHYTVDAPENLPLAAIKLRNEVPGTLTTETEHRDGRILYRFHAKDVPQVFYESAMFGAKWHALQRYHLSTVKSWEDVSRWYAKLVQPHLEKVTPELTAKVAELTAPCKSDAEKAAVLFRYVSREIRYMGLTAETTAPGYEPHDVGFTFAQRAGVCRDKAALLVAMLRSAGLKAHMVLISAGDHLDPEVPLLHFNHAVAAWEKASGNYELMDPTAENTQEMLPASDADSSFLVATEKGETLRTTPAPDPAKNAISVETRGAINYDEEFSGHVVCRPRGLFEHVYRTRLLSMLNAERLQLFQTIVDRLGDGITLSDLKITPTDTSDMSQDLIIEFDFHASAVLPESACAETLIVPHFSEVLGFRNALVGNIDLIERRHPRDFTTALIEEKITVNFPTTLQFLTLPPADVFHSRIADWQSRWSAQERQLEYASSLTLKTLCVEPDEYPLLKTLAAKLARDRISFPVGQLVFDRSALKDFLAAYPGVDDLVLSDDSEVELLPQNVMHQHRVLRRYILTPGGVRNHSEITFTYRPEQEKCQISAIIHLPDGTQTKLTDANIHEVDDPAFAGASRYAKGKKCIINLPGVCPGAIIELHADIVTRNQPFYSLQHVFGGYSPLCSGSFTLRCDAATPLKLTDPTRNIEVSDRKADGKRVIVWRAKNLPQAIHQPGQPPLCFFHDAIRISTVDLEKYAKKINSAMHAQVSRAGEQVKAIAQKLKLDDPVSEEEKLIRIRDWVDQHVRLAGPSLTDLLPDEFFPPETTIADGYGNSSDRAIVIAALCREAKVPYEFLLVADIPGDLNTTRQLSRVPDMVFNRVLVRRPGSDYFLNDTGMYAQLGATRNEENLGLTPAGKLCQITSKVRCESGIHRKYAIKINKSGSAVMEYKAIYYGNDYEREKAKFATLTPELRRRYFEGQVLLFSPAAKLLGAPQTDFSRYPGTVIYTFEQPDFGVRSGKYLAFTLPGYSELVRKTNVGSDRETPYSSSREDLRIEYEIALPPGFVPTTKPDGRRQLGTAGVISYLGRSSVSSGKILITHQLLIPRALLKTEDAALIELVHRKLNRPHEWRIVLQEKESK